MNRAGSPRVSIALLWGCMIALAGVILWDRLGETDHSEGGPAGAMSSGLPSGDSGDAAEMSGASSRPSELRPPRIVPRGELAHDEQATIELFATTSPQVAHIRTRVLAQDRFSRNVLEIPQGSGTGFIWDRQGYIVTNFHVIEDANSAQVELADHSSWSAELVGVSPAHDLAVLKLSGKPENLRPVAVGTSQDLKVGQKVFAIGNPFGLDQTLTTGIISAVGRHIESRSGRLIEGVIQTDAAINPGNSGGPLLDSSGRLIGMTTAIVSPSGAYAGIGFAIPVDTIAWVVPELIAHGRIIRASLAIEVAPDSLTEQLGLKGVLILDVRPGSTADRAGLRPTSRDRFGRIQLGDVITGIDGRPIESTNDLLAIFEEHPQADEVTVSLLRGREILDLRVRLELDDESVFRAR